MITRIPGRKGRYLAVLDDEGLHVVARLVGVTEARQQRSLDTYLAWLGRYVGDPEGPR